MGSKTEYFVFFLNTIRCIPHLILYFVHKNKSLIRADIKRNLELANKQYGYIFGLIFLLSFKKSFRNIFYYRIHPFDFFLAVICPRLPNLFIDTRNIGAGFAISHGFGCAIGAVSIGDKCTIFQQVTLGAVAQGGYPTILNNVLIGAGAVVIGSITIGNNVVIGANATVFTNVPDNCTVLPGSSKIMRWRK
jgi:serine O-acetyltransferase